MIRIFKCPLCGGELIAADGTQFMVCPHCQKQPDPAALETAMRDGARMPEYVVPFEIEKLKAQRTLKEWGKKFRLCPFSFFSKKTLKKTRKVYVSCRLYSFQALGKFSGSGTKRQTIALGTQELVSEDRYEILRDYTAVYRRLPVYADGPVPAGVIQELRPFDLKNRSLFTLDSLSGAEPELFQNNGTEEYKRLKEAVFDNLHAEAFENLKEFETFEESGWKAGIEREKVEEIMLPVWKLDYKYAGKEYPVYINGVSGKVHGTLPVSLEKRILAFVVPFAVAFAIAFLIGGVLL